jgi:FkbM family methyltransferase
MNLKKFVDTRLPNLAAHWRLLRDQRLAARRKFTKIALGFEMCGTSDMAESRLDSGELLLFLAQLKTTDVLIDVGANCGLFTLAASYNGVKAVAVEPNQENLVTLLLNLQKNKITDAEVFHLALADKVNVLPLFGGGEGASLTKGWGGIASNYSRLVPVNTLDNLFHHRFTGKRLLVKLDVEGNEYDVLCGAREILTRTPAPMWLVEHGFKENFSGVINPHFRDLFELFWESGYRCFTGDTERRPVLEADIARWMVNGQRDFGYLNYLFCR